MTKEEKKDELKNKISMALKDPVLQQGFEIICKNITELEQLNSNQAESLRATMLEEEKKNKRIEELVQNKYNLEYKIENLENKIEHHQEVIDTFKKENAELKKWKENTIKARGNDYMAWSRQNDQLTKAKDIILKLYNAGRDVLMCRAEEKAYDNLENAINDKSIEQFLKDENIILEDVQAGNSPFDADEVFNKEIKAYPEEKVK